MKVDGAYDTKPQRSVEETGPLGKLGLGDKKSYLNGNDQNFVTSNAQLQRSGFKP